MPPAVKRERKVYVLTLKRLCVFVCVLYCWRCEGEMNECV